MIEVVAAKDEEEYPNEEGKNTHMKTEICS